MSPPVYVWVVVYADYEGSSLDSIWTSEERAAEQVRKLNAANQPMRNGVPQTFPGYEVERAKLDVSAYNEEDENDHSPR